MEITEQDIYEAMLRKGWIIPTTVREVQIVEELFPVRGDELPERLRKPPPLPERSEVRDRACDTRATSNGE